MFSTCSEHDIDHFRFDTHSYLHTPCFVPITGVIYADSGHG